MTSKRAIIGLSWISVCWIPNQVRNNEIHSISWPDQYWADTKHDVCLQASNNDKSKFAVIPHKVDRIGQWAHAVHERFGGTIAIALELTKGTIVYALQKYDLLLIAQTPEIWEYIADDSINRADAFIDIVNGKLRTLAAQPRMGRARDELMVGLRSFPVGRYILFYELVTNGIALVRVLHSACDFPLNSKASDTAGELAISCSPCIEFPYRFFIGLSAPT